MTEVALAVVVLIGAGLLIRSFMRLRSVDPGFRPSGVLTVRVPLGGGRNTAPERRIAFFRQLTDRIAALPGVRAVGAVNELPLTGFGNGFVFRRGGASGAAARSSVRIGLLRSVTPAYFRAMGIPLVAGRGLADRIRRNRRPVIVVNQALARRFWPGGSAVGGRIAIDQLAGSACGDRGRGGRREGGAHGWRGMADDLQSVPARARDCDDAGRAHRGTAAEAGFGGAREVHALDPDQPVADVRTMEEVVNLSMAGARFNTTLLVSFAGVAFLLAAVGIYGVISYDVSQRTNEIGIRMALGAQPRDVRRMILGQGARLAVYGIVAGLLVAIVLTRWMGTMLFGVNPTDVWTFAAISILLAVVALAASYLPSRRAMALDPVIALRHE